MSLAAERDVLLAQVDALASQLEAAAADKEALAAKLDAAATAREELAKQVRSSPACLCMPCHMLTILMAACDLLRANFDQQQVAVFDGRM